MEDLISRRTIIDGLEFVIEHGIETDGAHSISAEKMLEFVKELPTVQPKTQWILCSDRLPDEEDSYIVTIQCEHVDGWDDYVTGFAEWDGYRWDIISFYSGQIKVVAWMELPSPYKGEKNDNI